MNLTDYIKAEHVVFLDETQKPLIIKRLVERAAALSLIRDKAGFETAVREREAMSTTGIGMGIAIPHGRCRETDDFFIIPGIARHPVEWGAIDYTPVKVIFMIGVPYRPPFSADNTAKHYLEIVAALLLLAKQPHRRAALFAAAAPEDLIAVLSDQALSLT